MKTSPLRVIIRQMEVNAVKGTWADSLRLGTTTRTADFLYFNYEGNISQQQ